MLLFISELNSFYIIAAIILLFMIITLLRFSQALDKLSLMDRKIDQFKKTLNDFDSKLDRYDEKIEVKVNAARVLSDNTIVESAKYSELYRKGQEEGYKLLERIKDEKRKMQYNNLQIKRMQDQIENNNSSVVELYLTIENKCKALEANVTELTNKLTKSS